MPKKDRHNEDYDTYADFDDHQEASSSWDVPSDDEDTIEFERRQLGAKRETAKRARSVQKQIRQEREAEFTGRRQTDKRALEKEIKRRFNELKRIADQLGLKQTLQEVNTRSQTTTWGPDVISDKNRPSVGVVLNYLDDTRSGNTGPATPSLFGAWLAYRDRRITITVGTKASQDNNSLLQNAAPPDKRHCILEVAYDGEEHDGIQNQIATALLTNNPFG
ncbi:MAG: hypothetical protein JXN59_16205 [Anaerolineae bacterium]|nr:hypothetical protein [Anaerolineae bacterium]